MQPVTDEFRFAGRISCDTTVPVHLSIASFGSLFCFCISIGSKESNTTPRQYSVKCLWKSTYPSRFASGNTRAVNTTIGKAENRIRWR